MSDGEKLKKYLIIKGLSYEDAAKKMGLKSKASISDYVKSEQLTLKVRKKLNDKLGFTIQDNINTAQETGTIMMIPLITKSAWAGFADQFQDEKYIDSRDKIPFPATHQGKGNYLAFEIAGDSMTDDTEYSIKEGSIVYTRMVPSHYWIEGLRIKEGPFVIVTKTGDIFLKRIYSLDKSNGNIILKSQNVIYDDIETNLNDIKAIYSVIHIMNKPIRY